jgi:exosortase/archaeosortase family protein
MILLISACAAAFLVNTIRTWALATIRFDAGMEAFDRAHEWLGVLAFLVSGTFFYFVSGWLAESKQRRVKRRVIKKIED